MVVPGCVRLRLSKKAARILFSSGRSGVSRGLDEVLDRYSERVEEDVLKEFLGERR